MLFWIIITAGIFALGGIFGEYLRQKTARENKLKKIAKRLEQIEKKQQIKDPDSS